ncbi:MAG: DM13 domain-containing protein [Pseudomonadota bacterium]
MRAGNFLGNLLTVLAGFFAGVLSVQLLAPDFLNATRTQRLPEAVTARMLAAGDFSDIDSVYRASGRAQLLDGGDLQILRFTEFNVSNAPNLEVWLSTESDITDSSDVRAADILPIAALERSRGDQIYVLPEGLDLSIYRSVLIWSAEFGVLYGVANFDT